jgi:hypothetical protein
MAVKQTRVDIIDSDVVFQVADDDIKRRLNAWNKRNDSFPVW